MKRKKSKLTKTYAIKQARKEIKKQFIAWSIAVRARDNNCCVICQRTDYVHAHHILPRELHTFRFNVDNGISLCPKHHKYSYELSPHKNPLAFFVWLHNNRHKQMCKLIYNVNEVINDRK
jgi:hypothetical protein